MSDVILAIGSPKGGVPTLIDNKTQLPISGATFSNQSVGDNSNPDAADFTADADGNFTASGKAAGSGTVVLNAHANWTDPGDGSTHDEDVTVTKNFTVLPSPDGATFDVVFP